MGESWYTKCLPQIKDIEASLPELSAEVKSLPGVKKAYIFGSFAESRDEPQRRVKDLDVIAVVPYHSGDLIAIDTNALSMKPDAMWEEGYDPDCVAFTKAFIELNKYAIDRWTLSKDKKLLHWGPMMSDPEEALNLNREAEEHAEEESGLLKKKLARASQKQRSNWFNAYQSYLGFYLSDMPVGWYKSDRRNVKEIIANAIEL